jgi:hypothetical protein
VLLASREQSSWLLNRWNVRMSMLQPHEERITASDRHLEAVTRSLRWAQESAQRGDYPDALAWIQVVEATGSELPPGFQDKRQAWLDAISSERG